MEVRLATEHGAHVATVSIPRFTPMAGVVIWGTRAFTRYQDVEYREAFAYYTPGAERVG